ncbi:MAG: hypothetical protein ACT4TC_14475 [Myxococcaceae bacterium]
MRTLFILIAASGVASPVFAADTTAKDLKREAGEALDTTARYVGEQKDAFESRMKARLDQLNAEIAQLKEKAKNGTDDVKRKAQAEVDALEPKKRAVENKLSELKSSGAGAWQKLKAGIEGAVDELERGIEHARKKK